MAEQELKQSIINLLSKEIDLFAPSCIQNNRTLTSSAFKSRQSELIAVLNSTQLQSISYYSNYANYINSYLTCLLLTYPDSVNNIEFKATTDTLNNLFQLLLNYINAIKAKNSNTKTNEVKAPTAINKTTVSKEPTLPTVTKSTTTTPEIALTPEQWGIKFTTIAGATTESKLGKKDPFSPLFGPNAEVQNTYFMDLLPARQSTIPVQGGRDVPNAMPGLNYKLVTQVGKQAIPGFSPVYQNLGIKGMQVTIVGAFTGGDGSQSNRKTDTPEPNSKTPFWSNAKGGPTLSDNPGRGGTLPELTAYNSSAEFKQVVYQGKQLEVEINLFQVYNQSTASQIGQDIKLQSKNGNPKFTGIVRSLEEFHATKERTWYTLIMDVTDFGMASKKPINLNNKLEEAIKNAQAQMEAAQKLEAEKTAEQEASTIPNDPESTQVISNIRQRILALKDPTQKKKQLAIYDHLLEHIKALKNKDNYAFKNYNGSQSWGTFISNIGTYSDSSFFPISDSQMLFRLRLDCRTLVGIQGTCDSELYWLLDGSKDNLKPITKFIGNGTRQSTFLMLPSEKRERIANDPFGFGPYPEEDGSENQRNSLLSQAKNLSNAERGSLTIKAIGCVAIGALGTIASVGTAGLATPGAIAFTLGSCAVFTSAEAYDKYDTLNKNEAQWSNAVWGELAMELLLTLGTVGLVRGGGALLSKAIKQGTTVASNPITKVADSFIENLNKIPDIENKLLGQTITFKGKQGVIESLAKNTDGTLTGNAIIKYSNGQTAFVNLNFADSLPNVNLLTQPKVTTTQAASLPSVNILDKAINTLQIAPEIKTILLGLPQKQKTAIVKLLKSTKSTIVKDVQENTYLLNSLNNVNLTEEGLQIVNSNSTSQLIKYVDLDSVNIYVPSTSTVQPQQPIIPLSALDNTINSLSNLSTNAKAALRALPDVDKIKAIDILQSNVADLQFTINGVSVGKNTTSPITSVFINDQGRLSYKVQGSIVFNVADLNNVTVSKPATIISPQPLSKPVIPQQQTNINTSQTKQPSTEGSGQGNKQYATVSANTTIELLSENVDNLPNFFTRGSDISYTMGMERYTLKLVDVQYNSNNNTISFIKKVKTNTDKTLSIYNEIDSNIKSNVFTYGMNKVYKSNASDISDLSGLSNQTPSLLTASGKATTLVTNNNIKDILPSKGNSIKALYKLNQNTNSLILSRFINPLDKLGDVETLTVTNIGNGKYRISTTASIQRDNLTTQIVNESEFLELFQSLSVFE